MKDRFFHLIFFLGCFTISLSHSASADDLVLVSPHWEGIRYEMSEGFKKYYKEKTHRDVALRWLDLGGTSDIKRFVISEFKRTPEGIGLDIFTGGGTDPYVDFAKKGLLERPLLSDELFASIPHDIAGTPLSDPHGLWVAPNIGVFGVLYSDTLLKKFDLPFPKDWETLGDVKCFSWVGLADPRKSGSIHLAYEAILQHYGWKHGWEILYAIAGNARNFNAASSLAGKDVSLGEVAYGLVIDAYASEVISTVTKNALSFYAPLNQTPINGDSVAMFKGAPHKETASLFIEFLLSDAGQKRLFFKKGSVGGPETYEIGKPSIRAALYDDSNRSERVATNPFTIEHPLHFDSALSAKRWAQLNDLIGIYLVNNQKAIASLQKSLLEKGGLLAHPLPPPMEEGALMTLPWDDFNKKQEILLEWNKQATALYNPGGGSSEWWLMMPMIVVVTLMAWRLAR